MEVDAAYQGCLPSCELHSRLLAVGRTGKVRRLRTRVTQSPDCAHVLRNLQIAHMCYAISRLRTCVTQSPDCLRNLEIRTQSRDSENAQRNLEIAQILRLRGTYTPTRVHRLQWRLDKLWMQMKRYEEEVMIVIDHHKIYDHISST